MVIRIQGTTSCGNVCLFRNRHTGQEPARRRVARGNISTLRQNELAALQSIEVDSELLTGNLDEDISILDLVA